MSMKKAQVMFTLANVAFLNAHNSRQAQMVLSALFAGCGEGVLDRGNVWLTPEDVRPFFQNILDTDNRYSGLSLPSV